MKIWLLRHPPVGCHSKMCYGQTDVPLAPGYADLLAPTRRHLPEPEQIRIYASDLTRCRLAAECFSMQVSLDPRLREMNFGSWEGRLWSDLPETELKTWSDDLETQNPPGGESCREMLLRCRAFWTELRERGEDCLVVTHTGWIRLLLSDVLKMPIDHAFRIHIDFCGLTQITYRGEWVEVAYINR